MPWISIMPSDDRVRFVAMYLSGENSLTQLARQFGVSRKTAYKWLARYDLDGWRGLRDRSRAPHSNSRSPNDETVALILRCRMDHPHWGPRKLRSWLETKTPSLDLPAPSTIGEILKRNGLVEKRRLRRRTPRYEEPFEGCVEPNQVWCTDFKGHFKMGNGVRCHPLTLMDGASRYLLRCHGMSGPTLARTRKVFEAAFREFGLPDAIRSDNGVPFAGRGAGGLSRLSAWWVRLGIMPERIDPGRPDQNGRHERMHRTLKQHAASPAKANLRQQQRAFEQFRTEYNEERPHEALADLPPARVFRRSNREYPEKEPTIEYPSSCEVRRIISNGRLKWRGHFLYINSALNGEPVGIRQTDDGIFNFFYGPIRLGHLDERRPGLGLICPPPANSRAHLTGRRATR